MPHTQSTKAAKRANPAADAAARQLFDLVATHLSRRAAARPCDGECRAAAWGLLAQLDSARIEQAAVDSHADFLRERLE